MTRVDLTARSKDYERVERALSLLGERFRDQPALKELAAQVGLSEYHFQRLFRRWVGISPKRFLQYLTKEHAKEILRAGPSLLEVSYQSGLSGPGRLHDLFVSCEAVTPGEYKRGGAGLTIRHGAHPSPFGRCRIAVTERGICGLAFGVERRGPVPGRSLEEAWPRARLVRDQRGTGAFVERMFEPDGSRADPLPVLLRGTNFQIKVWEALLRIPVGCLVSYQDLARSVGRAGAARAVGRAVGRNPVAFLIPCHRVIRKVGSFGSYRYGTARKKAILGWEAARACREEPL